MGRRGAAALVAALAVGLPLACGDARDAAWPQVPSSWLQWADGSAAQVSRSKMLELEGKLAGDARGPVVEPGGKRPAGWRGGVIAAVRPDACGVALARTYSQRPADVAQLAASILRPPSPWAEKRAPHHPALDLIATWRDSVSRDGNVIERRMHSAIRNTGRS